MRSIISIMDLSPEEITALMASADDIIARPGHYADRMKRKKLAALFYEPSTRTRLEL